MKLSNHLNTIYSEIGVWERVAHTNVVKIFELFDDSTVESMYLMMELCAFGQIQDDHDITGKEDLVTTNPKIYEIAVSKNAKIWPGK
jgi:serine/threonine protein kinase